MSVHLIPLDIKKIQSYPIYFYPKKITSKKIHKSQIAQDPNLNATFFSHSFGLSSDASATTPRNALPQWLQIEVFQPVTW